MLFQAILSFVLLSPSVSLSWGNTRQSSVSIRAVEFEEDIRECLDVGREARLRFEIRMCRMRSSWFDACGTTRVQTQSIVPDPITEAFKVMIDRFNDEDEPQSIAVPIIEEAMNDVSEVQDMELLFLVDDQPKLMTSERRYLQARVLFDCKGLASKTLSRISS